MLMKLTPDFFYSTFELDDDRARLRQSVPWSSDHTTMSRRRDRGDHRWLGKSAHLYPPWVRVRLLDGRVVSEDTRTKLPGPFFYKLILNHIL